MTDDGAQQRTDGDRKQEDVNDAMVGRKYTY